MRILILGANGFIGHHLSRRILAETDWEIYAMDLSSDRLQGMLSHPRFNFFEGDITINHEWIELHVKKCDVVLPLVAIATPATYISDPLRVFELDFEANLPIVRAVAKYRKRLLFPSTSEVYGMNDDGEFDPEVSNLVYGPVHKTRWIYACSKQLMDRVIAAYGIQHGLRYTLFRPFNWIGPGLDSISSEYEGSSRVVTQFLGNILRGVPISLVDGGAQRRCFTCVDDGIDALMCILRNPGSIADGKIYNIGNPGNDLSIAELAARMLAIAAEFSEFIPLLDAVRVEVCSGGEFYGSGYQDASRRVPSIRGMSSDLAWLPKYGVDHALRKIFDAYRGLASEAGERRKISGSISALPVDL